MGLGGYCTIETPTAALAGEPIKQGLIWVCGSEPLSLMPSDGKKGRSRMESMTPNPYAPRRVFPAKAWLEKRRAEATPPSASTARPTPQPAAPNIAQMPPGDILDLALLVSCLAQRQQGWLFAQLQPLVASPRFQRHAPRLVRRLRASIPPLDTPQGRLGWLRARLLSELADGLAVAITPLWQMSRPARNRSLIASAEALGQLVEALGHEPGADPTGQELQRALDRLPC